MRVYAVAYAAVHVLNLTRALQQTVSRPFWSCARQSFYPVVVDSMKRTNVVKRPIHEQCEYEIVKGEKYERYVKPYFQDFKTFAKGRWIGRELLEVFTREFGAHPPSYWTNALRNGQVRINSRIVGPGYRIANGDAILHRTHRHEPPVFGEITLVGETEELLAISKPPSLPMHPCGAYRHNSLEYILRREPLIPNQPDLSVVHRLDRVTSGLVVLAKSKAAAARVSEEIRDKATTKVYLARVKGRFPTYPGEVPHLRALDTLDLGEFAEEAEDYQNNGFLEPPLQQAQADKVSVVSAGKRPISNVEGDEKGQDSAEHDGNGQDTVVAADDSEANKSAENSTAAGQSTIGSKRQKKKARHPNKDALGRGEDINVEDLPPRLRPILSIEEVGQAQNVGVLFTHALVAERLEQDGGKKTTLVHSTLTAPDATNTTTSTTATCSSTISATGESSSNSGVGPAVEVWVKCPIGVISQRDGVHACDPTGKPSLSSFRCLGYCADSDTSLIECRPYTGRTHQLRLHLQLLGTPIANDPCYGGVLFYGDPERRQRAIDAVREMRAKGIIPLSKVPHFGDPAIDELLLTQKQPTESCNVGASASAGVGDNCNREALNVSGKEEVEVIQEPREGESEDDYLVRTCRYCQENSSAQLEQLLHCEGIWLHALRYTGPPAVVDSASLQKDRRQGHDAAVDDQDGRVKAVTAGGGDRDGYGDHVSVVSGAKQRWSFQAPYPSWSAPFGLQ